MIYAMIYAVILVITSNVLINYLFREIKEGDNNNECRMDFYSIC